MAGTLPTPSSCCTLCDGLEVEITVNVGGVATGNAGFFVVETLAELRAIASAATNRYAILLGNLVKYDSGPAKQYYWDQVSTDADNPFNVVVPNDNAAGPGRWIEVV